MFHKYVAWNTTTTYLPIYYLVTTTTSPKRELLGNVKLPCAVHHISTNGPERPTFFIKLIRRSLIRKIAEKLL